MTADKLTYGEAVDFCADHDGRLAVFASASEVDLAWSEVEEDLAHVWLGVNDLAEEDVWVSEHDGRPVTFTNWNWDEPNNDWGKEHCVSMVEGGKWNDIDCMGRQRGLCQRDV